MYFVRGFDWMLEVYIISYQGVPILEQYQMKEGCFSIKNVCAGNYHFYASVPGFIGDNRYDVAMAIAVGLKLSLSNSFHRSNIELGDTNNDLSWQDAV